MIQPVNFLPLRSFARSALLIGPLLIGAAFLVGCDSGERVYQLSGTITYKGQPVPSGMIIFEPDSSKGNSGAPGRSKIEDGKYDTSSDEGFGVVGGPHVIRIIGMDGKNHGETAAEIGLPNVLFPEHKVSEDLPLEDGVKNFEVPAARR